MEVKWYARIDDAGKVVAVFRAEWSEGHLVKQESWSRSTNSWQLTDAVAYSIWEGDNNVEPVTFDEVKGLLPKSAYSDDIVKGVPGPTEVELALSRLAILPNPNHPELKDPEKFVESPWEVVPVPTVDPNLWDDAETRLVSLNELVGTDSWLKRKNVAKHIEAMGQAVTEFRSWALIAEVDDRLVIIDGHHRLMALWLLGQDKAPAYIVKVD
jgi:3-methyladenine DNA glycosylase AlkD